MGDIQANINKITSDYFDEIIFKRSDKSKQTYDFYTDDKKTTMFLVKGSTVGREFFNVLEKFSITLIDIKNNENYLNNSDFFNFVYDKLPLITYYLENRKNSIVQELREGEIREYYRKTYNYESLNFVNYSINKKVIYDNITQLDTVSKIIEIVKLSIEDYSVLYNTSFGNLKVFEPVGVEYLQAYSIYCNPHLIITIYANGYMEPKGYKGSSDELSFKNMVINERKLLLIEAQALIGMCENRYDEQFSYLRYR